MSTRLSWLLALAGVCGTLLLCPYVSHAGLYQVGACTEVVGYVNNSWHLFDSNASYIEANSACHQEPAHELSAEISNLAVADVMNAGDQPVGVEAGWRFTAPAGTTISEVTGSDDLFKDTNNDWEVYFRDAGGAVLGGQTCNVELGSSFYCEVFGAFQEPGISTASVAIGIRCTENSSHNCPDGATIHEIRAELDEALVTINDPIVPTNVTATDVLSGSQHGTVAIVGSAADTTAGLLSLSVVNGANEVVGGPIPVPGGCDYSFTTPCPTKAENVSVPIDTTKLPNGLDQVRVEATNAAHDEGFSVPYNIDVENSSPTQGGGGAPEGGPKTGGSGGSNTQTGGSGTSSGQGPSEGPTTSTVSNSSTTPTAVSIHLDKVRRAATNLLISGHIKPAVTGTVTVRIWHTGSKSTVIRALHLRLVDGRFGARIALARRLRRRHLTVGVRYPGGIGYLRASMTQVVGPTSSLLR